MAYIPPYAPGANWGSGSSAGSSLFSSSNVVDGLGILGIGLGAAGSALQARAEIRSAQAQQAASQYNAALAEMEGRAEARRIRRIATRQLSSQYAQANAKSGVIAQEGSWLEVLASNAGTFEVDALNAVIRGNNTANLERARGKVAEREGRKRSGAAILGGVTRAVGQIASLY